MIKFKDERCRTEWETSSELSSRLKMLIEMIALFVWLKFGKHITITQILRTAEEQAEYYKNDPAYQKEPFHSVHEFGRGVDIRSRDFTESEIKQIVDFANLIEYGSGKKTAIYHTIGLGLHLHFQTRI